MGTPPTSASNDNVHYLVTPLTIAAHNTRLQEKIIAAAHEARQPPPSAAQPSRCDRLARPGSFCIVNDRVAVILSSRQVWINVRVLLVQPLEGGVPFEIRTTKVEPWPARLAFAPEVDWLQLRGQH